MEDAKDSEDAEDTGSGGDGGDEDNGFSTKQRSQTEAATEIGAVQDSRRTRNAPREPCAAG